MVRDQAALLREVRQIRRKISAEMLEACRRGTLEDYFRQMDREAKSTLSNGKASSPRIKK